MPSEVWCEALERNKMARASENGKVLTGLRAGKGVMP